MISEWELWACADKVIEQHGAGAPVFVAERIGALALAGDEVGIATWKLRALPRIPRSHRQRKDTPPVQGVASAKFAANCG